MRLTVVAEEETAERLVRMKERCKEYREEGIEMIMSEFENVLCEHPGSTETTEIVIDMGDARLVNQVPYRIPDVL